MEIIPSKIVFSIFILIITYAIIWYHIKNEQCKSLDKAIKNIRHNIENEYSKFKKDKFKEAQWRAELCKFSIQSDLEDLAKIKSSKYIMKHHLVTISVIEHQATTYFNHLEKLIN